MFSRENRRKAKADENYAKGKRLFRSRDYAEAERNLRKSLPIYEELYGPDYRGTCSTRYWLGKVLYVQKKYLEAEEHLRQGLRRQETTLGPDHRHTLSTRHWLGSALFMQEKYPEAEEHLRRALRGRETTTLGPNHEDTLWTQYYLGLVLYKQKKYSEAEEHLRRALRGQETTLGPDYEDTLFTRFWLGLALYEQDKYLEAEEHLRRALRGRETTLGPDHKNIFWTQYWLGLALYKQDKYLEAEEHLRRALRGQETTLGPDHEDTLWTQYYLGLVLYKQKKYSEAEILLRSKLQASVEALGNNHYLTIKLNTLWEEVHEAVSPLGQDQSSPNNPGRRLAEFFPQAGESRGPFLDSDILEISSLLKNINLRWSKVPRTYIVLRLIDCLNLLDELIDVGFTDYWFPVTERRLPSCLRANGRSEFVRTQILVLTKSFNLEKGQHCYFQENEEVPFERKEILGSGGFGQVDRVVSKISYREFARKLALRSAVFRGRNSKYADLLVAEIEILKRLKHEHIVELIGSYTDPKYLGLIMTPVAEMDLSTYLERADASKFGELRSYFGCLARALEFLHGVKVRHKDIKPQNILVDRGNILFTDFGLSHDFADASGSTTVGVINGRSPRYCSPEVYLMEPRNSASDIWSLGLVFLEMMVVLKGQSVKWMREYFVTHGSQLEFVRTNREAFGDLVKEMRVMGARDDNKALDWIEKMLQENPRSRPKATFLAESIVASIQGESPSFCGICCMPDNDDIPDPASWT